MSYLTYRNFAIVLLCSLAAFGAKSAYDTIAAKRAAEAQHRAKVEAVWNYLVDTVGTRTEGGREVPVNRADALAEIVRSVVEASKSKGVAPVEGK